MTGAAPAPAEAPHALPLAGHAMQLWRRPLPFLRELTGLGDLVTLRLGPHRAVLACSTEAVRTVLHDPRTFDKGGPLFEKARLLVGNGLVSSDFTTHRRQRLLMQPAFGTPRLPGYTRLMAERIDAALDGWRPGRILDMGREMHTLALDIAARTLFGAQLGERAVAEVVACMPPIMRGVYQRMLIPAGWVHRLPLPANRRFAQARATMHRVIRDTVRSYRRAGRDHGDVLSILVSSRDEHGSALSDDEIHDQVMTLLIGATEPPGDALTWVFHLLSQHPQAERALHGEADDVLRGGPARALTAADLPRLEHTRRIVLEALRLHPPAWLLSRVTTRDTVLLGHPLPPGTTVLFSPYQLHHDPAVFPDPERFDPGRWRSPSPVARAALLPFGAGNRKCIGDEVALTELSLVIAAVASRFRLRALPGAAVRPLARASLGAEGVMLRVERRTVHGAAADGAGAAALRPGAVTS
ncbi:cytochrome P450 [Streptomyces aidingensis]|uniref:Pentalenene oxygenase n=1 Tax=Streptomyces aidingensis TaxID=910347 RepID=A0A1I1K1R8_9ACTN|nr:cytochrome P450 [Streptomyces aidingensis]SFC54142.1 pentalenene oxygenase [Streptomyces aidingensis]